MTNTRFRYVTMDKESISRLISFDEGDTSTGYVDVAKGKPRITDDDFMILLGDYDIAEITGPDIPKTCVFYSWENSEGYLPKIYHGYDHSKVMDIYQEYGISPAIMIIERAVEPLRYARILLPLPKYGEDKFAETFIECARKNKGIWNRQEEWDIDTDEDYPSNGYGGFYGSVRKLPAKDKTKDAYKKIWEWMNGFVKEMNNV